MNTMNMTRAFASWLDTLRDARLKAVVVRRIKQAVQGNFGDCKAIDSGVYEMRIHYGAGWRLYYAQEGRCVYLLLSAGSKASQQKDIEQVLALWRQIKGDSA